MSHKTLKPHTVKTATHPDLIPAEVWADRIGKTNKSLQRDARLGVGPRRQRRPPQMVRILALDLAASIPGAPARADNATFGTFHDMLRAAAKIPARCADHGGRVYVTRDGCFCARAGPGLHANAAHHPQRQRLRPDPPPQAVPHDAG